MRGGKECAGCAEITGSFRKGGAEDAKKLDCA